MTEVMAVRNEYRMNHWAGIIEERRESGLSIREFCLFDRINLLPMALRML